MAPLTRWLQYHLWDKSHLASRLVGRMIGPPQGELGGRLGSDQEKRRKRNCCQYDIGWVASQRVGVALRARAETSLRTEGDRMSADKTEETERKEKRGRLTKQQ